MLAAASVGSAAAAAAGLQAEKEAEVENWTQQELRVQSHDVAEDDRKELVHLERQQQQQQLP